MPAFQPVVLTTQRLQLRFINDGDVDSVHRLFTDPEALRYWSFAPWTDRSQAEETVRDTQAAYEDGSILTFAITLAGSGDMIGKCRLSKFSEQNRRSEIGYILDRAHWGKGYAKEALAALIGHAFGPLDLLRIEADVDPRNDASCKLLERLHFMHEGHLRQRWIVAGEVCDTAFYGLLRQDWEAAKVA
ncbi:GNAT family N-acetyltransferase [Pseudoduganella ginsengisoli]|uniref:GNAT family N-acetyltransferase n=1 Tax=Pseudoduganella ginsengisoli TaxID=1462440 RepID=A0A6L6PWI5_9BURK|nr:GNAT family protein [Pseudoduganella ginsengisoli]MTW01800.1 GNAT family N-acetyltransferase [Pseudoduganella ginsengisoli]